jgi:hypothetical protein
MTLLYTGAFGADPGATAGTALGGAGCALAGRAKSRTEAKRQGTSRARDMEGARGEREKGR